MAVSTNNKVSDELVSVIIPVYNASKYIIETIKSVQNQTYPNVEIIVVDDGSTDESLELLKEFSNSCVIFAKENGGAASARNFGLLNCSGSLIAFLDSDDLWMPDKLEEQVKLLNSEDVDFVYCSVQDFEKSQMKMIHQPFNFEPEIYFRKYPVSMPIYAAPSSVLIKKSAIAKVGLFDTNIPVPSDDWDFFRRCSYSLSFVFSSKILVHYRIHDSNISRQNILKIYPGHRYAVSKMIFDLNLKFFQRRMIWYRLHLATMKAALLEKKYWFAILNILRIFQIVTHSSLG